MVKGSVRAAKYTVYFVHHSDLQLRAGAHLRTALPVFLWHWPWCKMEGGVPVPTLQHNGSAILSFGQKHTHANSSPGFGDRKV